METLLVEFAIALPVALAVAFIIARGLQLVFRGRVRLSLASMVIVSVLGISIGILISAALPWGERLLNVSTLLLAFGSSLLLSLAVAGVASIRRPSDEIDVAALLAGGETERVEFKETARWNVREQRKDARMEQVITKTVAAFLNTRGGTLVIGADDAGTALGLDRDLATLRTPDHDRFELWLRDLLSSAYDKNAAALPRIRFAAPEGGPSVCVVSIPRAAKPVYLRHGAETDLWVRVGNSTRSLGVDEAVDYVERHWRPTLGTFLFGAES